MLIASAAMFIALHFFTYYVGVRHCPWGQTEAGIFKYHAASFVFLAVIGLINFAFSPAVMAFSVFVAVCSLHAIYSMTFLEFWSLSQGSFSYAVLKRLYPDGCPPQALTAELTTLGDAKKGGRISGLAKLGLVRLDNGAWRLTATGRATAALIRVLLWIPATKNRG